MPEITETPAAKPEDTAKALLAEMRRANDLLEAQQKAKAAEAKPEPKPAPRVEQTTEQAIASQVDVLRGRADAAEMKAKELEEKWNKASKDLEQRAATLDRKSSFSTRDGLALMADAGGVTERAAREMGTMKALAAHGTGEGSEFQRRFGKGRTPLDVVMRGALVPAAGSGEAQVFSLGSDNEVVARAQELNDALFVWRMAQGEHQTRPYNDCPLYDRWRAAMEMVGKALDETDTANYVPTGFSSTLIERYDLDRKLTKGAFTQYPIPRSPFQFPVMGALTTTYYTAENTADVESATVIPTSDLVDQKVTFTLKSLRSRTGWSYEIDEDAIIAIANAARNQLAKSLAYSEESVGISGDTTNPHQDSNVTAGTTDVRTAFKGLRKHCIANSWTASAAAFSATTLVALRQLMGKYGVDTNNLVWVVPPSVYFQFMVMLNASGGTPVIIGAAYPTGPAAETKGEVQRIFGAPVIVSDAFPQNLNAAGVYDGTTTTKTGILLVNKTCFGWGYTSDAPTIEMQRWIRTAQLEAVIGVRRDLELIYPVETGAAQAAYGYNVTS